VHLYSSLENYLNDFHPTEAESLLTGLRKNLAVLQSGRPPCGGGD
jgi:hypothetical protein